LTDLNILHVEVFRLVVFKNILYPAFHICNLLNPISHHVLCFTFMLFQGWEYGSCYRWMF